MRLKSLLKLSAATVVSLALVAGTTSSANAVEKLKWKMQSAFGSKLSIIGEVARRYQDVVSDISGGAMKIKFFEPGALVPALEAFDAVSSGAVDAANSISIASGSIVFEGATADAYETSLAVTDATADRTITFPDATGTIETPSISLSVCKASSPSLSSFVQPEPPNP